MQYEGRRNSLILISKHDLRQLDDIILRHLVFGRNPLQGNIQEPPSFQDIISSIKQKHEFILLRQILNKIQL